MIRFFLWFLAFQGVLFTVELLTATQQKVIIPFTEFIAYISARLIQLFDDQVLSQGIILRSLESGFAVSIQPGCNGVEAVLVLTAAILAFPASWQYKAMGLTAGFIAIQALNLVRIISLFYLGQWNQTAFEWAHLYLWQPLIMLDALIIFLIWLRTLPTHRQSGIATHEAA